MSQSSRPTVCLTFDFDAISVWLGSFGVDTPTAISRGEFGARVGVPRILRLLAREQINATFYIPGHTVDSVPEVCAEIRDAGHEIGHHGYLHESPVTLDEQHEREVIEKGLESLQRLGVTPAGYRSPGWDLSANSVRLLLEYSFVYDSSMMGADYQPYWCRSSRPLRSCHCNTPGLTWNARRRPGGRGCRPGRAAGLPRAGRLRSRRPGFPGSGRRSGRRGSRCPRSLRPDRGSARGRCRRTARRRAAL